MRTERRIFITVIYWVIIISYLIAVYSVWLSFKEELREARDAKKEFIIRK
ncbi:MAG: hypothetical protein IT246_08575 [Bacteroidia bacterium]|nr:hypothetical protein [Bacteroidia bacterium]